MPPVRQCPKRDGSELVPDVCTFDHLALFLYVILYAILYGIRRDFMGSHVLYVLKKLQ